MVLVVVVVMVLVRRDGMVKGYEEMSRDVTW